MITQSLEQTSKANGEIADLSFRAATFLGQASSVN